MTDPISDMLIRIKNAQKAGLETVQVSYSQFKYEVARTLERAGLVKNIEKKGKRVKKTLEMGLNPKESKNAVNGVQLISKPSRRLYVGYKELRYKKDMGEILIISTSKGIMTGGEAYKAKLGGQLIAKVW